MERKGKSSGGLTPGLEGRILSALQRVHAVQRAQTWRWAAENNLNPAQVEVLDLLFHWAKSRNLSWVAQQIGVTLASASDSVSALVRKGLVVRERDEEDRRGIVLSLSQEGRDLIQRKEESQAMALLALEGLPDSIRKDLFQGLMAWIGEMQKDPAFPAMRTCPSCQFFEAAALMSGDLVPFCGLLKAPLPTQEWRVDCPEHLAGDPQLVARNRKLLWS